mgnify:CR=1 FL=1
MHEELLRELEKLTDEEKRILAGNTEIEKKDYCVDANRRFTIDKDKVIKRGNMINVRANTRFVHFPKHNHNYVEMIYVCKGTVTNIINDEKICMKAGEIMMMNQQVYHELLPAEKEDIAVNIMFVPVFFDEVYNMMGDNRILADFVVSCLNGNRARGQYLYLQVSDVVQVQNLMENIVYSLVYHKNGGYTGNRETKMIQATLGVLFMNLIQNWERIYGQKHESYESNLIRTVNNYIDCHYREGSLSELCSLTHNTMSGLSKMIKKATGSTFLELMQQKRFDKTTQLLEESSISIEEILHMVGYENSSYFYRKFYERKHMTPRKYRILSMKGGQCENEEDYMREPGCDCLCDSICDSLCESDCESICDCCDCC